MDITWSPCLCFQYWPWWLHRPSDSSTQINQIMQNNLLWKIRQVWRLITEAIRWLQKQINQHIEIISNLKMSISNYNNYFTIIITNSCSVINLVKMVILFEQEFEGNLTWCERVNGGRLCSAPPVSQRELCLTSGGTHDLGIVPTLFLLNVGETPRLCFRLFPASSKSCCLIRPGKAKTHFVLLEDPHWHICEQ